MQILTFLKDSFEEDYVLICEIIRTFMLDQDRILKEIENARRREDSKSIYEGIHALKSAVAVFGDTEAYEALARTESFFMNAKMVDGNKELIMMYQSLSLLSASLQEIRKQLESPQ